MIPEPRFTNHLAAESSPYLRQHAHNPVDWYPWGPEALQKARELDRPIFLSIGYSACHWCHVMEKESFENPEVGRVLNEHFISIKVDREERPDLDQIYMTAVQIMTRQGGWPMSMFLTPALKPFYGGTYFPPDDRYGRPGFLRLVTELAKAWREKRDLVEEQAGQLTENVQSYLQLEPVSDKTLHPDLLRSAGEMLRRAFDSRNGGFGSAPKFPHPMDLRVLLRIAKRFGDDGALSIACHTLDKMAQGGIYDHLGGGFHRYSTDAEWLVPHFEKMLYDNALLTSAYLEAYQATGRPFYRQVVEETLDYVLREMTSPKGGFFSTQDADSEGVEGKFFVWTRSEIEEILGPQEAELFCQIYDASAGGNWEGHNILHLSRSLEDEAKMLKMPVDELRRRLHLSKQKLFEVRSRRVWPGKDDKILTAWNGLMIAAFAQAGAVLDNERYLDAANYAASFLSVNMCTSEGLLLRTAGPDGVAKLNAYLEDYAFVIDALVTLYEASLSSAWIEFALKLTDKMIEQFWDAEAGGFFYTGKDHEQLIARNKDPHDSSVPSGNSMAVTALLRLGRLTGRRDLLDKAEQTLKLFRGLLSSSPLAAGQMLLALDFYLGPVQEFALVGGLQDIEGDDAKLDETGDPQELQALHLIHQGFRPNKIIAWKPSWPRVAAELDTLIPLLAGKESKEGITTYICRDYVCQEPLVGLETLRAALK